MTPRLTPQARAEKLLRRFLSPAQRRDLDISHSFVEQGKSLVSYRFMFDPDHSYVSMTGFCISARYSPDGIALPAPDQALGLLLIIRAKEEAFRATANTMATWPRPEYRGTRGRFAG